MFNRIPLMEDFQGKIKKYILSSWVKIKKRIILETMQIQNIPVSENS